MKLTSFAALFLASALLGASEDVMSPMRPAPLPPGLEIQFTSDGVDIGARVAELVGLAKREVLVSQYAITDLRVLQALSRAIQPPQSVVVKVLLDRQPAIKNYDAPRYLRSQGVPVVAAMRGLDGQGWHNQRYVVIDREAVIVTSSDLTNSARKNTENILVIAQPSLAARFYNNWVEEAAKGSWLP